MPSSQGSSSIDIEGEEATWLVHVSKKKDLGKDALLKVMEDAGAEEQRPVLILFHVVTTINTPSKFCASLNPTTVQNGKNLNH